MSSLKVSVLGFGAVGHTVATSLARGEVDGAELVGVVARRPELAHAAGVPVLGFDDALSASDLIAECAGVDAVHAAGPRIIEAGRDLLITSVGALIDEPLRARLLHGGPGRTFVTSGAIGGLDVLSAASRNDGLTALSLTTEKAPATVIQPWMPDEDRELISGTAQPLTVFTGTVADAIRLFPRSLNVAVALAHATDMWAELVVTMIAEPHASLTTHRIEASGPSGHYEFTIRNLPHPLNPATSGVVPSAVLQAIARRARPSGSFA